MPTQAQLEAAATSIFDAFSNQQEAVTYSRWTEGTYNPATDSYDGTPTTATVQAIFPAKKDSLTEPGTTFLVAWIRASEFRSNSIDEPLGVNDTITRADGTILKIKEIYRVPESNVPIAYKFHLTEPAR